MGILDETRFVERLQFFNGQRLFASDLQGIEAFNREMRWLHNQSLHQPGIGNGFAVTGKRNDREVQIGPGYALDTLGREIVLTRGVVEQIPPVASEPDGQSVFFDLTISYPADDALEVTETRAGICLPRGAVRLREEPVLCWVRLRRTDQEGLQPEDDRLREEIQKGLRIVLARAEVLDCRLKADISLKDRRSARPSRLPFIACGEAKGIDWEIVNVTGGDDTFQGFGLFRLHANDVDTSQAGFQLSPCYSVRIAGERLQQVAVTGGTIRVFLFDQPANILASRPKSFNLEILVVARFLSGQGSLKLRDLIQLWRIAWMGVE
jgi:hypothetical protein